jgi:hypothetical protein
VSVSRRAPFLDPGEHRRELLLPAEEGGDRPGEVRVRDRLERREDLGAELVDRDRLGEVLEAVLPELGERKLDELGRRVREDNLASVARGAHAGREVDVRPDVALGSDMR